MNAATTKILHKVKSMPIVTTQGTQAKTTQMPQAAATKVTQAQLELQDLDAAMLRLPGWLARASAWFSRVWPLTSFIATNPLHDINSRHFINAVVQSREYFGSKIGASSSYYKNLLATGVITRADLKAAVADLRANWSTGSGFSDGKTTTNSSRITKSLKPLAELVDVQTGSQITEQILANVIKWLAAYLDEGQAAWSMPGQASGFYAAWRRLSKFDQHLYRGPYQQVAQAFWQELPAEAGEAVVKLLSKLNTENCKISNFESEYLLASLAQIPGWTGYVKWRSEQKTYLSQQAAPIKLVELAAVLLATEYLRLLATVGPTKLAEYIEQVGATEPSALALSFSDLISMVGLRAHELAYSRTVLSQLQAKLTTTISGAAEPAQALHSAEPYKASQPKAHVQPTVQMIFCIDVRSEPMRRRLAEPSIQVAGGCIETLGFAGFFGLPIALAYADEAKLLNSCPALLQPKHLITERKLSASSLRNYQYNWWRKCQQSWQRAVKRVKASFGLAFEAVELLGLAYLPLMLWRSSAKLQLGLVKLAKPFAKSSLGQGLRRKLQAYQLKFDHDLNPEAWPLAQQIAYAQGFLKVMGLVADFAPVVILCGHGSSNTNNLYSRALDCGACGSNHGASNAMIMAKLLNKPEVRAGLATAGVVIPETTWFGAALHDTTVDQIKLLMQPESTGEIFASLEQALGQINQAAPSLQQQWRAWNWAEMRPEWGLAGNALFIAGPGWLYRDVDLGGRSFLQSYDDASDPDGQALEAIMTAPLVVAHWINSQYWFSSIDNNLYGSGDKLSHNPVGCFGVMQGNLSDLMHGLPKQSVWQGEEYYHQPLRLTAVLVAQAAKVSAIIAKHEILQNLVQNQWLHLYILDPVSQVMNLYQHRNSSIAN